jgi:mono/diheme cytochrome c family protein
VTSARRVAVPAVAGLVAAVAAFALVLLATRSDGDSGGGGATAAASTPPPSAAPVARTGEAAQGRLVFAELGCGSCHRLSAAGSRGGIGPSLDDALPHHTRASLLAKIRDPGAGTIMPQDFARRMSRPQLDALVAFLLAARHRGSS